MLELFFTLSDSDCDAELHTRAPSFHNEGRGSRIRGPRVGSSER